MGCDIHICTERKLDDGSWWCTDYFKLNPYYSRDEYETKKYILVPIYGDRNYQLFSKLAGVRSSYSYDEPIDDPRGLPPDVSDAVKEEADWWGIDGHSHSWFYASELFKYQKEHRSYQVTGMISPKEARELDECGRPPTSWCRWTTDPTWVTRTWSINKSILDDLVKCIEEKMCKEFWIYTYDDPNRVKYQERLDKYANDFRIVFWFDN